METAEENQLLKEYVGSLGATSKDYFIGGSDLQTDGTFIWEHSGDLINLHGSGFFHDWMSIYQPDNTDDLHCMVLYGQASHMWNDVSCTYAREFICEKDP
ncbi:perlucin-like [Mytilus trossulus]|uniref:perlucin-like n=1 Tax=Mytilus trossulus TaxID=6551 RepID=UPI003004A166